MSVTKVMSDACGCQVNWVTNTLGDHASMWEGKDVDVDDICLSVI
jgi:hypothetical protein